MIRLRNRWLFLDPDHASFTVQLHDAIPLGVSHVVAEYGRALGACVRAAKLLDEPGAVEDIVAQHQCRRTVADELPADDERLSEAVRLGLTRVGEAHSPLRTVAEE